MDAPGPLLVEAVPILAVEKGVLLVVPLADLGKVGVLMEAIAEELVEGVFIVGVGKKSVVVVVPRWVGELVPGGGPEGELLLEELDVVVGTALVVVAFLTPLHKICCCL